MLSMSGWRRYRFKGRQKAWVRMDDGGEPLVQRGRIEVAFKRGDVRTYQAATGTIAPLEDAEEMSDAAWEERRTEAAVPPSQPQAPDTPPEPEVPASPPKRGRRRRPAAVKIWTDGACFGNPGPSGAGALLVFKGRERELRLFLGEGTNNTAELEAIRMALVALKDRTIPVDLHTDSSYAIGVLTLGWRAKANREMIMEIRTLVRSFENLRILKVAGHAGIEENERVDQLAKRAITEATGREPT